VRIRTGTSGYSYAPWKGVFYPEKLAAEKMLGYYAGRLATVEINNTFYRMPKAEVLGRWAEETPAGFTFAVKAPRRITHDRRLANADEAVAAFFEAAGALGDKLGPVLFQLPPFLRKDAARLEAFLRSLRSVAPSARAAFEFRHASWFAEDVYDILRGGGAALCIAESDELATPLVATADWGYLRLRRTDYAEDELAAWADRLRGQPWQEAFVYFKHEEDGKGPRLAERLAGLSENLAKVG
jgi:uncharacterized protein YecE (DUF72 family)